MPLQHSSDEEHNKHHSSIKEILTRYMGKNTPDRQMFIVDNLRIEKELDFTEEDKALAAAA
jgi:topoisomerase-4 subunit B